MNFWVNPHIYLHIYVNTHYFYVFIILNNSKYKGTFLLLC